MSHLNGLQALLNAKHRNESGGLWSPVRDDNFVKVHQTPNVWGERMSRNGVMEATDASVTALADAMGRVIASGQSLVDITSLDPPRGRTHRGVFWEAISGGIEALGQRRGSAATVRFLFGFPPGKDADRQPHHDRFKRALLEFCGGLGNNARPNIVYGVYARNAGSTGPYFNHAKIVASDVGRAIVGGHNLYDADYLQYPPVHDVSVEVWGRAATDAQNFAAYLWAYGGISDPTVTQSNSISWNPVTSQGRQGLWDSTSAFLSNTGRSVSNATQAAIVAWQLTDNGWQETSPTAYSLLFPHDYVTARNQYPIPPDLSGYHRARILTVGRAGGWGHQLWGDRNASDYMKEYLFQQAASVIRIAHQDLVAIPVVSGFTKIKHSTCQALANALTRSSQLQVHAVVSAPWGCGRMDEYTNVPNGPQTAADYIMYYATNFGSTWASERPRLYPLWQRLLVAPFYFTDKVPEGHYFWPSSDEVEGCEGGITKAGYPKSVGNHSKVMIVDDTLVVGSDNHYPHPLAEINLVMEGDIVDEFKRAYWEPLWRYSAPHAVRQWANATVLTGQ